VSVCVRVPLERALIFPDRFQFRAPARSVFISFCSVSFSFHCFSVVRDCQLGKDSLAPVSAPTVASLLSIFRVRFDAWGSPPSARLRLGSRAGFHRPGLALPSESSLACCEGTGPCRPRSFVPRAVFASWCLIFSSSRSRWLVRF
jgi:hypothetical protein